MPYEKINKVVPEVGQVWENIGSGDRFVTIADQGNHMVCAVRLAEEDIKIAACKQVLVPKDKLRSWGNRGFNYTGKHKGKLPEVHEKVGVYNTRHVCYGAR